MWIDSQDACEYHALFGQGKKLFKECYSQTTSFTVHDAGISVIFSSTAFFAISSAV